MGHHRHHSYHQHQELMLRAHKERAVKMALDIASDKGLPIDTRLIALERALSIFPVGSHNHHLVTEAEPQLYQEYQIRHASASQTVA